jgi:DNA replication protein DnaC
MENSNSLEVAYTDTCPTHGEFESKMLTIADASIRMGCPTCMRQRTLEREEEERRRQAENEARMVAADTANRRAAGIPLRFEGKTLSGYRVTTEKQREALEACQRVVSAFRDGKQVPNLLMVGKPGTGKSHLCCGIVLELYRSKSVRRVDLPDLIREIRATWAKNSQRSEDDVLDFYGSLDLLILEEVGTGSGSDDEKARIFQVINRRYESMLPTIVVTNLKFEALVEEMGERVIDRLREGERSVLVFNWESERATAGDTK